MLATCAGEGLRRHPRMVSFGDGMFFDDVLLRVDGKYL